MDEGQEPPAGARLVLGAHWGFLAFFGGLGGYYLVTILLTLLMPGEFGAFDPTDLPDAGPLVLLAFLPTLVLGLGPAIGSWSWGRGLRAEFGLLPTLRDLKVGLACGAVALVAGYLASLVLLSFDGDGRGQDDPVTELGDGSALGWRVLAAVIVVIAAPLGEELLIRGALWNALAHYRIPQWTLVVLTAVVFAQLHGEPDRTVVLLVQGLAIGVARSVTGRCGASLVAHAANNLPPAVLLFVGG